jgi:hypothetical protein
MEVAASLRAAAARFPVPEAPVSLTQPDPPEKPAQEARERTQAISLVQRRSQSPGALEAQEPGPEPPPGDLFSQPPGVPGSVGDGAYTLEPVGGGPVPEAPPEERSGASVLLFVFVGIAVVASATTVLWYVLYMRG